ncbi:MAG TPA: NUDIX domain-containing protein [Candidatus Saccharimonadales bacterium]|nr:NUDIX domain-containing protein [Candidatus Saccharimonadales bacterium]
MAHIHTAPGQHDHTVSMYLLRTDFDEPKMMLHLHKKAKLYAQFGGHIELDETPWQTTIHEMREETGYDITQLKLLQPSERMAHITGAVLHPQPVVHATMGYISQEGHFHTDSVYAFIANSAPDHSPAEGESTDIQLFSRLEITDHPDIDPITRDIALYVFDRILPSWEPTSPSDFAS